MTFKIGYLHSDGKRSRMYDAPVIITPLFAQARVAVCVYNSCPTESVIYIPATGSAKPANKKARHDFKFITPDSSKGDDSNGHPLAGTKVNWRGNGCA